MHTLLRTGAVALALVLFGACGGDDASGPRVSGSDTEQELVERWWNWAATNPEGEDPITDPDGSQCAANQPDDVWFLAPTFGDVVERSCTIPVGRQVFAPVINQVCSPDTTCDLSDPESVEATLDGEPLLIIEISNDLFTITGHIDNPVTFAADPIEVVASGQWVSIGSLTAGEHVLVLRGEDDGGFSTDVTYRLTVA